MKLDGKAAIVTGGGRGIGRAIALRFAEEGADVALWDIDSASAEHTAAEVQARGRRALALTVDVGQRAAVEAAVEQTFATLPQTAILVNNAGISRAMPFLDLTEEAWDAVLTTNLKAPYLCAQAVARRWVETGTPGRIVNITSVDAELVYSFNAHYCASKAGLRMLTKAMALALAPHKITVNELAPGLTVTSMTERSFSTPLWQASLPAKVPLNRTADAAEMAAATLFLVSDEATYITGATLTVDGGHSLGANEWIMKQFMPS